MSRMMVVVVTCLGLVAEVLSADSPMSELLARSDIVVVGRVTTPPQGEETLSYCVVTVEDVLYGTVKEKELIAYLTTFERGKAVSSFMETGEKCIFFLKGHERGKWWANARSWFSVLPYTERIAIGVRRTSAHNELIRRVLSEKLDATRMTDTEKILESVIIPEIDFRSAVIWDVIGYLQKETAERAPGGKGVVYETGDGIAERLLTLRVDNISVLRALKPVAELLDLKYTVGEGKVSITKP
jgi:hypothetical protein